MMKTQTKIKILWLITGFMLLIACSVIYFSNTRMTRLEQDIQLRSQEYVGSIGQRPLQELDFEQRLILMHSYFNLKNDSAVVAIGESMVEDLKGFSPLRQKPFIDMIDESFRRLDQEEKGAAFRLKLQDRSVRS